MQWAVPTQWSHSCTHCTCFWASWGSCRASLWFRGWSMSLWASSKSSVPRAAATQACHTASRGQSWKRSQPTAVGWEDRAAGVGAQPHAQSPPRGQVGRKASPASPPSAPSLPGRSAPLPGRVATSTPPSRCFRAGISLPNSRSSCAASAGCPEKWGRRDWAGRRGAT